LFAGVVHNARIVYFCLLQISNFIFKMTIKMNVMRTYSKLFRMKRFFFFAFLFLVLIACNRNPLKVNVSDVPVELKIKHLDVDLLKLNEDQIGAAIPELKRSYGEFFDVFTYRMISIGGTEQDNFPELLYSFISDTLLVRQLVNIVKEKVDIWFNDEARRIIVIAGGDTRQKSVFNGLNATPKDTEFVIVHDGVRPFLPVKKTLNALDVLNETAEIYGIIAAVKITDTIKSVSANKIIESTIDRDKIWAVQTPQIFKFQTLLEAHQIASEQNLTVTDDAALLEYMGKKVGIFESDRINIKITEPYDLLMAELVLNQYIGNEEVE